MDRVFSFTKSYINNAMSRVCKKSGVKKIQIHNVRHSHAGYLINLECVPLLISELLGHEKVQTTLSTYSHLYLNKYQEVVAMIQNQHWTHIKKGSAPCEQRAEPIKSMNAQTIFNYSIIVATRPEPTVRPPSRIANVRPCSIAIGWISSIVISTLSPGMHISVPAGRLQTPVTSVVLK